MNWLNTFLILLTAFVVVFFQSTVTVVRDLTGVQPERNNFV